MSKPVVAGGISAVVVLMFSLVGTIGYQQGWVAAPELQVEITVKNAAGKPIEGASVEALGVPRGTTDASGVLGFGLAHGIGEEVVIAVTAERPGLVFAPGEARFVVRRWDRSEPESLRYALETTLAATAVQGFVEVVADGEPIEGAKVKLAGKSAGETDASGRVTIDFGTDLTREGALQVSSKGFAGFSEKITLAGGETHVVELARRRAPRSPTQVRIGFESLGRFVAVSDAELALDGRTLGTTDGAGRVKLPRQSKTATFEVRRKGFLPSPATVKLGPGTNEAFVPVFPLEAPRYRVVLLPIQNGSPGDAALASALPEIEEQLADHLFSYACFERANASAFTEGLRKARRPLERAMRDGWAQTPVASVADVLVQSEVTLGEEAVLSVKIIGVSGTQLGAFAESQSLRGVRKLTKSAADRLVASFPFEGHVVSLRDGVTISLGSQGERGLRRGQTLELFRPSGPGKLTALGPATLTRVEGVTSTIELSPKTKPANVGDKVVLLPRVRDASAFNAALDLTVMAGTEGAEVPFGDVNVYRDGTWVGVTAADGTVRVPVEAGRSHELWLVLAGVKPYRSSISVARGTDAQTIVVPSTMTRLRIESEPPKARVFVDGREVGTTPVDVHVGMGFRRLRIDGGAGWRAYDQVLELTSVEKDLTGSSRIVLEKDTLAEAEAMLGRGENDAAIELLRGVGETHPDYSSAHNLLGGLLLDVRNDADGAIREFEAVLARPENRELVNKRFTVTFLNLGRAYYVKGGEDAYTKAIENLEIARDNKRFFPREGYDRALHDTQYYLALASHRLYHAQPSDRLLQQTATHWRAYFDFFPDSLSEDEQVKQAREGALQYYEEIKRKLGR